MQAEGQLRAGESLEIFQRKRMLVGLQAGVGGRRDLHEDFLQLGRELHADAALLAETVPVFRVGEDDDIRLDALDLLCKAALRLVKHRQRHHGLGLTDREPAQEQLAGAMALGLRRDEERRAIDDLRSIGAGIDDLDPRE